MRVIGNVNDFNTAIGTYFKDADQNIVLNIQTPDFEAGQVILIDDGENYGCAAHLAFDVDISVKGSDNDTVKLLLGYVAHPAVPSCVPADTPGRPFYFYYIKSKKLLVFEEKVK